MQSPKKTTTVKDTLRTRSGLPIEAPTPVSIQKDAVDEGRKPLPSRRPAAPTTANMTHVRRLRDPALNMLPESLQRNFDVHITFLTFRHQGRPGCL